MNIKKHLIITGNSTVSWKDAIVKAIAEASKSIDYLSEVKVLEQRAVIDGGKISGGQRDGGSSPGVFPISACPTKKDFRHYRASLQNE